MLAGSIFTKLVVLFFGKFNFDYHVKNLLTQILKIFMTLQKLSLLTVPLLSNLQTQTLFHSCIGCFEQDQNVSCMDSFYYFFKIIIFNYFSLNLMKVVSHAVSS